MGITIQDLSNLKKEIMEKIEKRLSDQIEVPIEVINDGKLPIYANPTDAGADIFANKTIYLGAGETKILETGIKVAIPEGFEIQIRPRSGISLKTSLRIANAPGTIDTGYRDEIGIILNNVSLSKPGIPNAIYDLKGKLIKEECGEIVPAKGINEVYKIQKGEKIAQMVLSRIYHMNWKNVNDVKSIGENRGGGFGHTGC